MAKSAVKARLRGYSGHRQEAIDVAIVAELVHEQVITLPARGGMKRTGRGLFDGPPTEPAPGQPLTADDVLAARQRLGLNRLQLAEQLRVSRGLVSQWEHNKKKPPAWLAQRLDDLVSHAAESNGNEGAAGNTEVDSPPASPPLANLSADELQRLLDDAGWPQARLGISTTTVCGWCRGRRPVPAGRVEELRSLLSAAATDARERVRRAIQAQPGVTREALTRGSRDGTEGLGRGQAVADVLDELLAAGLVHRKSHIVTNAADVGRAIVGLFPGPAPAATPMSGPELRQRRRTVNWSPRDLAHRLDVSHTQVQHWEKDRQPIPQARADQLRELLADADLPRAPYVEPHQSTDDELVAAVVALVVESPGLPKRRTVQRMPGDVTRRSPAIQRAEAAGLVERRPAEVPRRDGRVFTRLCLFPTEAATRYLAAAGMG